jgi:hypothetical protein
MNINSVVRPFHSKDVLQDFCFSLETNYQSCQKRGSVVETTEDKKIDDNYLFIQNETLNSDSDFLRDYDFVRKRKN